MAELEEKKKTKTEVSEKEETKKADEKTDQIENESIEMKNNN